MEAYIKRRADFAHATLAAAESYTLPVETMVDATGTVEITGYKASDLAGDWLYLEGRLMRIAQTAPHEQRLTLTVADPITAFDRQLVWAPPGNNISYGYVIQDALEREYLHCPDSAYRLPYLRIVNADTTPMPAPELDDTKLYKLADIMLAARAAGVSIVFAIGEEDGADTLEVRIGRAEGVSRSVVFTDGHAEVVAEQYSADAVAKVTVLQELEPPEDAETDAPTQYQSRDYYLAADGRVAESEPPLRAAGRWEHTTCGTDDDPLEVAAQLLEDNLGSYKIEFRADRTFHSGDRLRLRLDGAVFRAQVSTVYLESKDRRQRYVCGDLPVTLTEKLRAHGQGRRLWSVAYVYLVHEAPPVAQLTASPLDEDCTPPPVAQLAGTPIQGTPNAEML